LLTSGWPSGAGFFVGDKGETQAMTHENNVLIINKQELIQAALELEKQETLHACLLFHCLNQLEDTPQAQPDYGSQ